MKNLCSTLERFRDRPLIERDVQEPLVAMCLHKQNAWRELCEIYRRTAQVRETLELVVNKLHHLVRDRRNVLTFVFHLILQRTA